MVISYFPQDWKTAKTDWETRGKFSWREAARQNADFQSGEERGATGTAAKIARQIGFGITCDFVWMKYGCIFCCQVRV